MLSIGAVQPCAVEAEEPPFTSAEVVRLVQAALDRLRRAADACDHLASALSISEGSQEGADRLACPG